MKALRTVRKLKIVLVVGTLDIGGTEAQVAKLAIALQALGHEVSVLAMAAGGPWEDALRSSGVPLRVFHYRGLPGWRSMRREGRSLRREVGQLLGLWCHLKDLRPDVCHAFLFTCYTHVLPLARAAGVPVRINGRRGASPSTPTGVVRKVLDYLGDRSSTGYICNSHDGARGLTRGEGVRPGRITVIENGVQIPAVAAAVELSPPSGIVVANLLAYKGHTDLIEALAMLQAPPRMCFVGEGPERVRLRALLEARGLENTVELAGLVPDAHRRLPAYQFAVSASHTEGLPNAVLEAMAVGLPVIATRVGGVPELVEDGVTGLLVPAHAPGALAEAIALVVGDPRLRVRLGTAARRSAERFSVPACAHKHEATYLAQLR